MAYHGSGLAQARWAGLSWLEAQQEVLSSAMAAGSIGASGGPTNLATPVMGCYVEATTSMRAKS
jgi:hypothetical protein